MESSAINTNFGAGRRDVRAYLAGGGASAAMVIAAIVLFLAVAAFVGFNGLPFGADDSPDATVELAGGAPETAGAAAGAAGAAVAATPSAPSPAALEEIFAAAGSPAPGPGAGTDPGPGGPGTTPTTGGPVPPGGGPGPGPGPGGQDGGLLSGTVAGVEQTAGNLGLNVPLTDLTEDVTAPLDKSVGEVLDGVGGAVLGNPKLGSDLQAGTRDLSGRLLGDGGATDKLLGK